MKDESFLDSVESGLRSTRSIILTINIIGAFLFLLVFEIVLGWQQFRLSASKTIFSDAFSKILVANSDSFTAYELEVKELANYYYVTWLEAEPDTNAEVNKENVRAYIDAKEIWVQEEVLSNFMEELKMLTVRYEEKSKKLADTLCDFIINNQESDKVYVIDSLRSDGIVLNSLNEVLRNPTDTLSRTVVMRKNEQLSFYVQEILDRSKVNAEASGRLVSRRDYAFPIIGTDIQIEDVSIPVVLFLILLTFWMRTSIKKAYDSARILLEANNADKEGLDRTLLKKLLSKFQFMRWKESSTRDPLPNGSVCKSLIKYIDRRWSLRGVFTDKENGREQGGRVYLKIGYVWLLISPYLVVTSSILINAHEYFVIDIQQHGLDTIFCSDIDRVFIFLKILLVTGAMYLAWVARYSLFNFVKLYLRVLNCSILGENNLALHKKGDSKEDADSESLIRDNCERRSKQILEKARVLYYWLLLAPFVLFGTFSAFQIFSYISGKDYFPSPILTLLLIAIWAIYGVATAFIFKIEVLKRSTRMCLGGFIFTICAIIAHFSMFAIFSSWHTFGKLVWHSPFLYFLILLVAMMWILKRMLFPRKEYEKSIRIG